MFRQAIGQVPLVLGEALQLPFDRIEGMRADIVDKGGEGLAIVGEERDTRVGREFRADGRTQRAPASQAAERVIFRRQFDAECRHRLAPGEEEGRGGEMECH